jgi:HMG (high mobility group) box
MREDLKGKNLSFTEIAKLVGENWQNLSANEKEPYETQASKAKDRFNAELAEYKKTENHRTYAVYLTEFKEKQARLQQRMLIARPLASRS